MTITAQRKRPTVLVAVTNRSSYNKVKTIVSTLNPSTDVHFLLGNSIWLYRYGDAHRFVREDFPLNKIHRVSMNADGDELSKMTKSVGMGCIEISTILDNLQPDLVITVADRYETLATATAASYANVPLIHIQGGEVSGTIDDKVRNSITQLADYHFPATEESKNRIIRMKPADELRVWNFGCPSMDTLIHCRTEHRDGLIFQGFENIHKHGHGDTLDPQQDFVIVMVHPDTKDSFGKKEMDGLMEVLDNIVTQKIIFWNNIDPGGEIISKEIRWTLSHHWRDNVRYLRHIDPFFFGCLLKTCKCIVGNSSAGIREATFLGTPSVTLGNRQIGRECGENVKRSGWNKYEIAATIFDQMSRKYEPSDMYGDGNAGSKIANKILEITNNAL